MSDPVALNATLIDRLIRALGAAHAPIVDYLNPGLSEDDMAALVAPLGIVLPDEAKEWWGYADGVPTDAPGDPRLTPNWSWQPLAETVQLCREMREIGNEDAIPGQPPLFPDTWLPIVHGDGMLLMDTAQPVLAPVYRIDWHTDDPREYEPTLPSLGALVATWTRALDNRAMWYDRDQQVMTGDGELLDAHGIDWVLVV